MDVYKEFNFSCTDIYSKVNTDVLLEQVSAGSDPILSASAWVRGIWIWIGIEALILVGLFVLVCIGTALSNCADYIKENCSRICEDLQDFVKGYTILN